jgi:PAS domain S-box-containing protein
MEMRSLFLRYSIAIGLSSVVLLVTVLAPQLPREGKFFLALAAIVLTAWYGGRGPGWLATLFSALTLDYFLVPPIGSFWIASWEAGFVLTVFVVVAVLLVEFSEARRRDHRTLQASEERWKAAFENNPTMYFMIDQSGIILSVNPFGAEKLGYRVEDLVGSSVLDIFYEVDREAVQRHVSACLTHVGQPMMWEFRKVRKDGRIIWVRETAKAVRFAASQRVVLVACEDITDRKRGEEVLQERANLLDLTHDSVFVRDMKDVITFWNRGAEELYGWRREEAVGQVSPQLMQTIFPAPLDTINEQLRTTGRWEGELIHTKRDGTQVVVVSRWSLQRDGDGNPVAILETNNDITERKGAEEAARAAKARFEGILDIAQDAIISVDSNQRVILFNQGAEKIFGYTQAEVIGRPLDLLLPQRFEGVHRKHIEDFARSPDVARTMGQRREVSGRRKDGGEFPAEASISKLDLGSQLVFTVILRDITERKRTDALLAGEKRVLEMVAKGDSLGQILDSLCRLAEEQAPNVLASILLVEHNVLRHGGAPSLPKAYTDAIDGVAIGPCVGSCGTAAHRGEQVIVSDIATDPLWADYRAAALPHSLRACWSTPIFSSEHQVIGTFAMYYRQPGSPSPHDQEIIGQITDLAGIAIQRKLAEEKLRQSEAYLAEGQALTHAGSWAWNVSTREVIHWSEECFRIFEFDRERGLPSWEEWNDRIHPEDRDRRLTVIREAIRQWTGYEVDYRIMLPDRIIRHLHTVAHPVFGEAGDVAEFVGTVRDVTERKQAEQRLLAQHTVTQILAESASLQEAAPRILQAICESLVWDVGALWTVDQEAGVLRCAEVWLKEFIDVPQFEARSREMTFKLGIELPGAVWESRKPIYLSDLSRNESATFPRALIAAHEGLHAAFAFPILLGGDVLSVIEFFSREIRQPDQDLLDMMITVGSQIGQFFERKRAEDTVQKVELELAHVARVATLGELTASIAHEINQPLGAIVNNAGASLRWLAAQNVDEVRQSIERVIKDGHRASEIISRIRALVKKTAVQKDRLNLTETLREVLALVDSELQAHCVALQLHLSPDLPAVLGDRIQVQQVLLNLMMNAIEAMTATEAVSRELRVGAEKQDAQYLVVRVQDSGPGITPPQHDRLFEPFYSTKPGGLGMGLAICRSIIEAHGGRLWATANEDRGAAFHFTLPIDSVNHD